MNTSRRIASICAVLIPVLGLAVASPVEGAFVLRLTSDDGTTTVTTTIPDGGASDSNPASDAITFTGTVGIFGVTINGFTSSPPPSAELTLNSAFEGISSTAPGTLTIELTDTDFPAIGVGALVGSLVAVPTSPNTISVNYAAYKNTSNAEFDTVNPEAELQFSGNGGSFVLHGTIPSLYSMTLVTTLVHDAAGSSTLFLDTAENTGAILAIPEPASLALFGIGLLGAGVSARRRLVRRRSLPEAD